MKRILILFIFMEEIPVSILFPPDLLLLKGNHVYRKVSGVRALYETRFARSYPRFSAKRSRALKTQRFQGS